MNILIAGDSWGIGEWPNPQSFEDKITHGGIAQFLSESGHNVENISRGGASNTFIARTLNSHLDAKLLKNQQQPDIILVFQSDYIRDYMFRFEEDWTKIKEANDLAGIWIERFYHQLSNFSKKYNIPVYIIGGSSEAMHYDNIENSLPGVKIICQSMMNLIINDNPNVDQPVFSWYSMDSKNLLNELKKTLPNDKISDLIDLIDQATQRYNLLSLYPEYFFPDGIHPNRHGHKKLFDFLRQQNIV